MKVYQYYNFFEIYLVRALVLIGCIYKFCKYDATRLIIGFDKDIVSSN